MIESHQCANGCGVGSTPKPAQDLMLEKKRRRHAKPWPEVSTNARGKKAFVEAWTQVTLTDLSTDCKATLQRDEGPSKNCDILSIHHTGTNRALGVFAETDIPSGYMIISEPPALSCVHWKQGKRTVSKEWLELSHKQREILRKWFRKLQKVAHGGNDTFKDYDKQRLEKFISDFAFSNPQRDRAHIYRLASHINHAYRACANAQYWVDSALPNRITIRTVRNVIAGDEIFICYNKRVPYRCPLCPKMQTISSKLKALIKQVVARSKVPEKGHGKLILQPHKKFVRTKSLRSVESCYSEQTLLKSEQTLFDSLLSLD